MLPESVLIADCDSRKIESLVVVDFHVDTEGPCVEVLDSVDYLDDNSNHTAKHKQKPHQPVNQISK